MKNYLIKLFAVTIMAMLFVGCGDADLITYDVDGGQSLLQFATTSSTVATPEGGSSIDFNVLVTTKSSSDRTIQVEVDPSSTATSDQYTLSNLTIPANEFVGRMTVSSNFEALPESGSTFLVLNLTGVDGAVNPVIRSGMLSLEFFRKCPPPSGDYVLELVDSYGDGWDGAFITVSIDGVSENYTATNFGTTHTVNVPEGTEELVFSYTTGSFESEHTYKITSPNDIVVKADGPSPSPGVISFNPCNI